MKRHLQVMIALVALATGANPRAEEPARHVVMISIDGLRPVFYTQPGPAKIPTIRRLMQQGAWARGVTGVLPSVTYPSHTTLITGVLPARHGIFDNRILDPEGTSNMAWFWYARDIRVTTLPAAIRARGLTAAAVSWPVTVGMDLDYNMPEIARSRHAENMELVDALSWPKHLIDIFLKTIDKPFGAPWSDMDRAGMAAWLEREFQPNLLLLHIAETDGTAHEYGPDSPEALAAVERADAAIARVLESVQATGAGANTDVVLVSDHGFVTLAQQLQPNAAFRKEGLLDVDGRGTVTRWDAWFQSAGGSGYVYLRRPSDPALISKVGDLLGQLASNPANGIEKIWSQADLARAGAHPQATFGITMRPGFYSTTGTQSLLVPAATRGGHGFDPARPEMKASLVMVGPDVPRVGDLGVVPMTRIAPTLARWFGVQLSPDADAPLDLKPTATTSQ